VGDDVLIMPAGKPARIRSIEAWPERESSQTPRVAIAGQSVGITLDRDIFVERGDVVCASTSPAASARRLRARVFWLHQRPLAVGGHITVRIGTAESTAVVAAIEDAVDPGLLASDGAEVIAQNHVGEIELALSRPIAIDPYTADPISTTRAWPVSPVAPCARSSRSSARLPAPAAGSRGCAPSSPRTVRIWRSSPPKLSAD
jgi:bifunctional enzyme CysN/CysC